MGIDISFVTNFTNRVLLWEWFYESIVYWLYLTPHTHV